MSERLPSKEWLEETCTACHGDVLIGSTCSTCHGAGRIVRHIHDPASSLTAPTEEEREVEALRGQLASMQGERATSLERALSECARVIPSLVLMALADGHPWILAEICEAAEAFRAAVKLLPESEHFERCLQRLAVASTIPTTGRRGGK